MDLAMILIYLTIGIFMSFICYKKTGIFFNYGTLFCGMWTITGVMANSGIYDLYTPSGFVNIVIIVAIIIFGLIYCSFSSYEYLSGDEISSASFDIHYRLIFICNGIAFVFMIPYFTISLGLIASEGFAYVRAVNFTTDSVTGRSTLINLVLQDVCYPLIIVTLIFGAILFFMSRKYSIQLILVGAVNMTVYEIINGARNGFVIAVIIFVFAYIRFKYPFREKKENIFIIQITGIWRNLFIVLFVMGLIGIVAYITTERSLGDKSIFENFYHYFFAGPAYLTALLDNLQGYKLNEDLFWGSGTVGFIYNIFVMIFNTVFGSNLFNSGYVLNSVLSNAYLYVSPTTRLNAMATVFFPFLMDFGYLGIVIGPIILVITSIFINNRRLKKKNIRWYAIDIFWLYVIYRTVFKWELIAMSSFFILFFIVVFTWGSDLKQNEYSEINM